MGVRPEWPMGSLQPDHGPSHDREDPANWCRVWCLTWRIYVDEQAASVWTSRTGNREIESEGICSIVRDHELPQRS